MKANESRAVGAICLALAVLFVLLADYPLAVLVGGYGVLCFVIPQKLFPSPEKREAARQRHRKKARAAATTPLRWYQSPVIIGIVIASVIFVYYAVT